MLPLSGFANLLYPPTCLLCHAEGADRHPVCARCIAELPAIGRPCCRTCGRPIAGAYDAVAVCAACRAQPPAFDAAQALWRYEGAARRVIHAYKYERRWRLAPWMAGPLADAARSTAWDRVDAVVPVPRHWLKARWRGVDHTTRLAEEVARRLGVPCAPRLLRRRRWTAAQSRLTVPQRRRNVRTAFAAAASVRGQRLLLVDDVLTSGATAEACARALRDAGAREVLVLTAAVTVRAPA